MQVNLERLGADEDRFIVELSNDQGIITDQSSLGRQSINTSRGKLEQLIVESTLTYTQLFKK